MGIFSALKNVALEANEEAHGARLESGLQSTMTGLQSLQDNVRPEALIGFLVKRQRILGPMSNWSREGCIQVARALQDEARKHYDFNITESYACWMAGAWLESSIRNSTRASAVHKSLEGLARGLLEDPEIASELQQRT